MGNYKLLGDYTQIVCISGFIYADPPTVSSEVPKSDLNWSLELKVLSHLAANLQAGAHLVKLVIQISSKPIQHSKLGNWKQFSKQSVFKNLNSLKIYLFIKLLPPPKLKNVK